MIVNPISSRNGSALQTSFRSQTPAVAIALNPKDLSTLGDRSSKTDLLKVGLAGAAFGGFIPAFVGVLTGAASSVVLPAMGIPMALGALGALALYRGAN